MSTATYNRIYSTMFKGSLYGTGPLKIACWAYVLAEMKPDFGKKEFYVELNAREMANAIGVTEEEVVGVISDFCGPEEGSRDMTDGKKLVRQGQYTYLVINGAVYNDIKKREVRREQNRLAQQRRRAVTRGEPLPGENLAARAVDQNHEDQLTTVALPEDNEPQWMSQYKALKLKRKDENDNQVESVGDGDPV